LFSRVCRRSLCSPILPHSFPTRRSSDLTRPMIGKVKDFLDDPAGLHINHNGVLDFWMSDIPQRRIGKGAFSCGKLGMKCGLDLRSEEHTSELQSRFDLVCRLLLEKKKQS